MLHRVFQSRFTIKVDFRTTRKGLRETKVSDGNETGRYIYIYRGILIDEYKKLRKKSDKRERGAHTSKDMYIRPCVRID